MFQDNSRTNLNQSPSLGRRDKKDPMVKLLISENRRANLNKNQIDYQQYMDKMEKQLNQNILDNIRPYWRNHASLKGKLQKSKFRFGL